MHDRTSKITPIYEVAYGTVYNADLRAVIAVESENELEAMLEQEVKGFLPNANPQVQKIRPEQDIYQTELELYQIQC